MGFAWGPACGCKCTAHINGCCPSLASTLTLSIDGNTYSILKSGGTWYTGVWPITVQTTNLYTKPSTGVCYGPSDFGATVAQGKFDCVLSSGVYYYRLRIDATACYRITGGVPDTVFPGQYSYPPTGAYGILTYTGLVEAYTDECSPFSAGFTLTPGVGAYTLSGDWAWGSSIAASVYA